jgi:hypothetical protein
MINMATTRKSDTRLVNYNEPGYLVVEFDLDIYSLQIAITPSKIKYKNPTIRVSNYGCRI